MLDRSGLPALDDYCRASGLKHRSGRGNVQRWDCDLAEHSHQGNLAITVDRGLWCCHGGCGGGDVLDLHMDRFGLSFVDACRDLGCWIQEPGQPRQNAPGSTIVAAPVSRPPAKPDRAAEADSARKIARAGGIWNAARPITSTPAAEYLFGRTGTLPPADADIRFVPDLQLFGFSGPAMVGRISAANDAGVGIIGLHLTWLRQDGGRWVRTERRYLGRKSGGVVRLWPDEAVTWSVAIAEGIETALAASHLHGPVWACLDAGNLAAFPVLPGIESLTIFADNDESGAGQRAAATCAERWLDACEVLVLMPSTTGADVADEVASA